MLSGGGCVLSRRMGGVWGGWVLSRGGGCGGYCLGDVGVGQGMEWVLSSGWVLSITGSDIITPLSVNRQTGVKTLPSRNFVCGWLK